MNPKCSKCFNPSKPVGLLKLEAGNLICPECGTIVEKDFVETDGAIISDKSLVFEAIPGDRLFLRTIRGIDEKEPPKIVDEVLPEIAYEGGKKIASYKVAVEYKVFVTYK